MKFESTWKDNIKICLKITGQDSVDGIYLVQDRGRKGLLWTQ